MLSSVCLVILCQNADITFARNAHQYSKVICRSIWCVWLSWKREYFVLCKINFCIQVSEVYKKFRFTLRFVLGNLHDFDPQKDAVDFEALPLADKYMLFRLGKTLNSVEENYKNFQFFKAYQVLFSRPWIKDYNKRPVSLNLYDRCLCFKCIETYRQCCCSAYNCHCCNAVFTIPASSSLIHLCQVEEVFFYYKWRTSSRCLRKTRYINTRGLSIAAMRSANPSEWQLWITYRLWRWASSYCRRDTSLTSSEHFEICCRPYRDLLWWNCPISILMLQRIDCTYLHQPPMKEGRQNLKLAKRDLSQCWARKPCSMTVCLMYTMELCMNCIPLC